MNQEGRIYLSGGGDEHQSSPLDSLFFGALPLNSRLLYVPTALRGHASYKVAPQWLKKVLHLHHRTDILFETADDLALYRLDYLQRFAAVYIGGGNTWQVMQEFEESGFSEEITAYVRGGGVVYGGSAGAIILGRHIDTHDDEYDTKPRAIGGLNILGGYSVACHYTDEQSKRFRDWAVSHEAPIMCLSEETGLVFENKSITCVGTKPCEIYVASGTRIEMASGTQYIQ